MEKTRSFFGEEVLEAKQKSIGGAETGTAGAELKI